MARKLCSGLSQHLYVTIAIALAATPATGSHNNTIAVLLIKDTINKWRHAHLEGPRQPAGEQGVQNRPGGQLSFPASSILAVERACEVNNGFIPVKGNRDHVMGNLLYSVLVNASSSLDVIS